MYVVEDDDTFDVCWYIVQIVEKKPVYAHKVSRRENVTQFIWSHHKTKALRFLTTRGLIRFIRDYKLTDKKNTLVLIEKEGRYQGVLPASAIIED